MLNVTVADLSADPHPILHRLRDTEPVAWIPALKAWLVTSHRLGVEVMLDAESFTVDDPRFSTQQVIGPSMLSLDGSEHRRHRDPFAGPFRARRIKELEDFTNERARRLADAAALTDFGDLRKEVAGPLAVDVMAHVLDLSDVATGDLLGWYEDIVAAVHAVTSGEDVPQSGNAAFGKLKDAVLRNSTSSRLLRDVDEDGQLSADEVVSNVAVLLFGGIVTSESSSAIAFKYLLEDRELQGELAADSTLVPAFVEESLRIEPSAAAVDRYATRDVSLGGAEIATGDLVRVSLSAANRDPEVFSEPDRFDLARPNLARNLTFARGPHACLGVHLARMEAIAALNALAGRAASLRALPGQEVTGLVFRTPGTVSYVKSP